MGSMDNRSEVFGFNVRADLVDRIREICADPYFAANPGVFDFVRAVRRGERVGGAWIRNIEGKSEINPNESRKEQAERRKVATEKGNRCLYLPCVQALTRILSSDPLSACYDAESWILRKLVTQACQGTGRDRVSLESRRIVLSIIGHKMPDKQTINGSGIPAIPKGSARGHIKEAIKLARMGSGKGRARSDRSVPSPEEPGNSVGIGADEVADA